MQCRFNIILANTTSKRTYFLCVNLSTRLAVHINNGGGENAGVEKAGVIKYGKPSKEKTVRY